MSFLLFILSYVLYSLGMYTISCRRGLAHPWLSWVPFLSCFQLGTIADHYKLTRVEHQGIMRWVLLVLGFINAAVIVGVIALTISVAVEAVLGVATFGLLFLDEVFANVFNENFEQFILAVTCLPLLCLPYWIAKIVAQYQLFKSSRPDLALVFLLLSIFVPFVTPVLIMVCKEYDDGMVPEYLY
jgi:hypothetical protein